MRVSCMGALLRGAPKKQVRQEKLRKTWSLTQSMSDPTNQRAPPETRDFHVHSLSPSHWPWLPWEQGEVWHRENKDPVWLELIILQKKRKQEKSVIMAPAEMRRRRPPTGPTCYSALASRAASCAEHSLTMQEDPDGDRPIVLRLNHLILGNTTTQPS